MQIAEIDLQIEALTEEKNGLYSSKNNNSKHQPSP